MSGFAIAGDITLSADETTFELVSGAALAEQQIRAGIQQWQGQWRYDRTRGLPALDKIFGVAPDLRVQTQIFRDWLRTRGGVASVDFVSCTLNRETRELQVSYRVIASDGNPVAGVLALGLA